jgi:hypothetical protein
VDNLIHIEIEELDHMVKCDGWRVYFRNIMSRHRQYLVEQLNVAIEHKDQQKIYEIYARIKECEGITGLVRNRLNEIQQQAFKPEEK